MTTVPKTFPARIGPTQQVNYIRQTVNWNDPNVAAPTDPFARLPANALILGVYVDIVTAFNAATTNVLTIGTSTTATELVAAGDVDETATGCTLVNRGMGTGLTVSGEVNLYAKYAQTGTAATAGKANVVIAYTPDNDG